MIDMNEIRATPKARACKGDDCEGNHCPKCGAHTLGWLDTFEQCSTCELEEQAIMEEANERAEASRETPLGEQIEDQGELLDPIGGEWN
jgi:hypothetical protein